MKTASKQKLTQAGQHTVLLFFFSGRKFNLHERACCEIITQLSKWRLRSSEEKELSA